MAGNTALRVLIFGVTGMLGHKLYQVLAGDMQVIGTTRHSWPDLIKYGFYNQENIYYNLNVLSEDAFAMALYDDAPDVVVNCVGITSKEKCEGDITLAVGVNTVFPHRLQSICSKKGIRLIHISTDCVFSGDMGNYSEHSRSDAYDVYGKSKYMGEVFAGTSLTIRTSFIGKELETKRGLLEWFMSNAGGEVQGYNGAIFTGFPTVTLSHIIKDIILNQPDLKGLYHVASLPISKYRLLNLINNALLLNIRVIKTPVDCNRSLNGSKFKKATGFKPKSWDALIDELAEDVRSYGC